MHQTGSALLALLALLVLTLEMSSGQSCPRSCNCYQANEVHCTFRSLLIIPPGLPSHTRRINLGFNSISRLHDKSLVGLRRVELLMLHSNNLQHLPDGVFKEMKSLQILKLSYNKLREISSSLTFSGLTSLLRLYLDHNLLQHIHPRALLQLPSLRLLRLQGNRLHQLHPHALCTLSILNTYYFSTLRHLDLSNNSLTILPEKSVTTAPLLETLVLQANPWSCDCRMNWLLSWSLAHPGVLKCPGGPQCPVCASPLSLQGQNLLDQATLHCTSPIISFPGKETPLESDHSKNQPSEKFREPLGNVTLGLSDQQGHNVDLSCEITHSTDSPDITPPPDLSWSSSSPLPLALSLSLDCPILGQSYEKLWRILAYYSETAARLEREIMLSKAPTLAYRYRQAPETDGYYHTGIKASVKARPEWLLQSAISIQLDRAQSNRHKVQLIYSTRVSAHPDPAFNPSLSSPTSHPWVMILTNHTNTAVTAVGVAGRNIQLSCPVLSSSNPSVQWILPDGSKLDTPFSSLDGRFQLSASGLLIQRVQLSDGGLYHCVARAGRDFDVLQLRLAVQESAFPCSGELSGPPVTGTIRDAVNLPCRISGSPEPLASWILPDGNVVWQGLAVSSGLKVHSNGSLSLLTSTLKDTGYYRCIAVNQYGSDTMSVQLILKAQHISALETSFPRGPQSAAGRSTKIPVTIFGQIDEGSGDEENEEDEKTSSGKRRYPTTLQQRLNRQYLIKNPQRYGRVREGPLKRIGGPISPTKQKKYRFQNRPRVTTKKHRIDPQKWADLLAKIRQKTTNSTISQTIAEEKNPTQPIFEKKDEEIRQGGKGDNKDRSISYRSQEETESEGSSVDDATVKEEQPQPIKPPDKDAQIIQATQTIPEICNVTERPHVNLEIGIKTQTEKESKQTVSTVNPVTETERFTLTSLSGANGIALQSIVLDEKVPNLSPNRTRPQNPLQGLFPNAIPNSRPRRPWDTRRKIGQRRRINRPKIQPVPSQHPRSDPINSINQAMTFNSSPDKITKLLPLSTTTFSPIMLTLGNNVRTIINDVTVTPVSPTVSNSHFITISNFESPPLSPSSTIPHTYTNMMMHSGMKQITEESTFNSTPAPTHANIIISESHVPEPDNRAFTHAAWAHTATQTTLGKQAERPPSKHSKELEMNVLGESHFSVTHFLTASSVPSASLTTTSAAQIITTSSAAPKRASYFSSTKSTPASATNEDTLPTTTTAAIISPTMFLSTPIIIPIPSTPKQTSALSTSMTSTITLPTTSSTIASTLTSDTTLRPIMTKISTTSNPSTSKSSSPVSINAIPKVSVSSFSTTSTDSKTTLPGTTESILTTTSPSSTTKQSTDKTLFSTTTTMELTSTKPITRNTKATGQVDDAANGQNRSQSPTDWKNHGANTIPDSHRSSFHQPAPSLSASPTVPVVRSRPRIADPHIRTLSVPAGSTVKLVCEAQGEPKPSITWTKVATGVVMSIHYRAQRFEVLPNGTLVIQNVQVQDRGTYICSASSLLGRDRLLTTLEIWTRPPHMQLMPYKEVTIHQGGQVHLECQADGVPDPLLSWVLPNRSTLTSSGTFSNRIHMDTNGTLHISIILPTDRGLYRCVASNSAGAASASVRLHVSLLPPVIQQPRKEHLFFSVGWPVYAHCSARGSPTPILHWRIPDGKLVRPSQFLNGNLFVLSNGTLHIRNVGSKDTGNYECTASNAVGITKRTVTIALIDGETKAKKPSNSSFFSKFRTSVIPSQTSAKFSPSKFSPVNPFDRSTNLSISSSSFNSSSSSSLKINKTVKPYPSHFPDIKKANPFSVFSPSTVPTNNTKVSPRGNSTRVASSFHTSGKISTVLQPQPVSPFTKAHIVSTSPSATTVNYEGTLNLYCSVSGNPTPTILWRTPTRKLVDMHYSFDQRVKVHPNGTLSVRAVTEKDSGDYLCIARNKVADDYRILRVSVVTKSPRIDPKQSINQMVSLGKPLKVDCQASGLPHPAVRWKLPNGTTVKSELFQEDNRGQRGQHTVFDNGTLLIPAVGEGDEGEYICYAENQAGRDTMKVIVKAMKTTPPKFTNGRAHDFIKVQQGETATIPCRTMGDPAPTVTWFSPSFIVIPQNLGSGLSSQRVVVISDGTLEVRSAQKIDSGNYTCRASNSAGIRSMVVTLEVETSSSGVIGQVEKGWSEKKSDGNHRVIAARKISLGSNVVTASKNRSNNSYSNNHSRKVNIVPNTNLNSVFSGSNPTLRSYSQHEFKSPVREFSTRRGNTGIMAGANEAQSTGIKIDSTGLNRNTPSIQSRSGNVDHSQSTGRGESTERNREMNNNEVIAGKKSNDANTSRDNSRLTRISTNGQSISGSLSGNGAGTSTQRGPVFNRNSHAGGGNDNRRNSVSSSSNSDTHRGGGKITKHQAVKGQAVTLPCPYQGYPPLRLAWLLPGNGMLPAPYYGSRLTVHRNGSLEFQDVRVSDGGNLVCVAKTERGDTLMRVQLEVSEPVVDVRSQQGREVENIPQKENLDATQSLPTKTVSLLQPSQRGLGVPDRSHSANSSASSGSVSKPTISTSTAPLVSTINGETVRLHCPASTTRGSVSWTIPSGKILSRGEAGDLGRYVVQEDGTLIIKQVSVFDRGSYICRFSSHDSSSVSVTTVPVIVIAYPPRITIGPSPVTYTRGGVAVELPCMAIATPRATVSWETPDLTQLSVMGQPRIYGNLYLSPQGSLVIQNPTHRDTGFYRCSAKNVIGVDSKATYLHVM